MSTSTKISMSILILLLLGSVAYSGFLYFVEIKKLNEKNQDLMSQLDDVDLLEQKHLKAVKALDEAQKAHESEKAALEKKLKLAQDKAKRHQESLSQIVAEKKSLQDEMNKVTGDHKSFQEKFEMIQKDYYDAQLEMSRLEEQIKAYEAAKKNPQTLAANVVKTNDTSDGERVPISTVPKNATDDYWAIVLKEKAELQVKYDSVKDDVAKQSVAIAEFKQKNVDLKLEMDQLKEIQKQISRDIEHKDHMINNLSLELARTKSDNKFHLERVRELSEEGRSLRESLKKMVDIKTNLEKSVVQLQQDKKRYERELGKTEVLIQNKIDEIWDIKDSLNKTVEHNKQITSGDIELNPIVIPVNGAQSAQMGDKPKVNYHAGKQRNVGFQGKVLSYNRDNNFVIVNIGKRSGLRVGDALSIYRGSDYIARLEVIQLRTDIAACDIKEQWKDILEGDAVR